MTERPPRFVTYLDDEVPKPRNAVVTRTIASYPKETPNTWKGALNVEESLFPSSLTLNNAVFRTFLSASDLELRERRLIVSVLPSRAPTISGAQPIFSGTRVGSYLDGVSTQKNFGSLGRQYNLGIRITCSGYTQSVLQCDAKQGTYRIPPCTSISVAAVLSRVTDPADAGVYSPVSIRAELSDSCDGPVVRPTETVALQFATNTNCAVLLNPFCRWIDFSAGDSDIGTATAPILTAYPDNQVLPLLTGLGPGLRRNYVDLTWFPSGEPIDLGGGVGVFSDYGQAAYRISHTGTGTAYTQFVQYLEW